MTAETQYLPQDPSTSDAHDQAIQIPYPIDKMALLAVAVACEKKGFCPVVLDLRALPSAPSAFFVIVSASNNRQAYAIGESIRLFFKDHFGMKPLSVDGLETATWVLLDYGSLFIHVFLDPTRDHYSLEQLWSKARCLPSEESDFGPLYKEFMAQHVPADDTTTDDEQEATADTSV